MSVKILEDYINGLVVFYDSERMVAFGPVMEADYVEAFLKTLRQQPSVAFIHIAEAYQQWRQEVMECRECLEIVPRHESGYCGDCRLVVCPECNGSGRRERESMLNCAACGGSGDVCRTSR